MQEYFKANTARTRRRRSKNLTVLIADQAKMEADRQPDRRRAAARCTRRTRKSFRTPERVKVRHILLKTQGKPPAEEAKIKAKAEDLLKQVQGRRGFRQAGQRNIPKTPARPDTGGEYTVQKNGQMVPEFENAAFTLKPGESEIVKTTYGYHVIQVMQHDPARLKPFDEVKAQLAADWKKQKVNDVMQQISDKAQTMLQKDPTHPEKVAADLNMQLVRADGVEANAPIPEIGVSPDFDQSVSGLQKGEVSQPVALAGNKIALAVVLDVMPPPAGYICRGAEQDSRFDYRQPRRFGAPEPRKGIGRQSEIDGRRSGQGGQVDGARSEDLRRHCAHGRDRRCRVGQLRRGSLPPARRLDFRTDTARRIRRSSARWFPMFSPTCRSSRSSGWPFATS